MKIILLEDDMSYGRLVRTKLMDVLPPGSSVDHVTILHELIERLARERYDAVLLDLMVPDSWGIETFQLTYKEHPKIPIIVLTGINDEYLATAAVKQGAQDYLVKGKVDEFLLVRSIRYSIERKKVDEQLRLVNETLERKVNERTAELSRANLELMREIAERRKVEEELRYRVELEKMIAQVAADFIKIQPDEVDQGISLVLKAIGEFMAASSAAVYQVDPANNRLCRTHSWSCDNKAEPPLECDAKRLEWLLKIVDRCETLNCPLADNLPEEAAGTKLFIESAGALSMLAIRMVSNRSGVKGLIVFFSNATASRWNPKDISLFKIFSAVFANSLDKKAAAKP